MKNKHFNVEDWPLVYGVPTSGKSTLLANYKGKIIDTDSVVFDMLVNRNFKALKGIRPWMASGIQRVQWNIICKAGLILSGLMAEQLDCPILSNLGGSRTFDKGIGFFRDYDSLVNIYSRRAQIKGDPAPKLKTLAKWAESWESYSKTFDKAIWLEEDEFMSDYFDVDIIVTDPIEVNNLVKDRWIKLVKEMPNLESFYFLADLVHDKTKNENG